jgi:hypothetical protein
MPTSPNGEIILTKLTDFFTGCFCEELVLVSASHGSILFSYSPIDEYISDAGYMKLDETNTTYYVLN